GLTAESKTYDANTTASLTGTAAINALGNDKVSLDGTATGAFADKKVGEDKAVTVTVTGLTLTGDDAGNYTLVAPNGLTASISKANLDVTGLTAESKTYDANTTASLTGAATVNALGNDNVSLDGTATGAFADKKVGKDKAVTVTGLTLTGDDAGNYTLVAPNGLTASISKANLDVTGLTAESKTYDANTTASLTGTAAINALGNDNVSLDGTATGAFADKKVGKDKAVTVTGLTLTGDDAGNYTLVAPNGLTASISKANLDVTGLTAESKTYDANTTASLTGTAAINALGND
ncbi:filamentous hemagglutinin, partial [Marinomonas sp. M1K-6]